MGIRAVEESQPISMGIRNKNNVVYVGFFI